MQSNQEEEKIVSDIWNWLYLNHSEYIQNLDQEQVHKLFLAFQNIVDKYYLTKSVTPE